MGLFTRKKKQKSNSVTTLKVADIKQETSQSISIGFAIPDDLTEDFRFVAGQYITLIVDINGQEVRRSYSICSDESDPILRIGVKRVGEGIMSNYLPDQLQVGDEVRVLKPEGNFRLENGLGNYVGIASGSGITPVLSQMKKVDKTGGSYRLFYGNHNEGSTMFKGELDQLNSRCQVDYFYTGAGDSRFTVEFITDIFKSNLDLLKADGFYLCGPQDVIENAKAALRAFDVPDDKVHFELFVANTPKESLTNKVKTPAKGGSSQGTILLDGEEIKLDLDMSGDSILDQVLDQGYDAPYSCKGAVCCTCRAKVTDGAARMDANYSLSDKEVEEGYILTCQSHPTTPSITVDYDQG